MRVESQESKVKGQVTKKSEFLKSVSSQTPLILATSRSQYGFTLIEVMLSLAIIVILSGLSIPVIQTLQVKGDLDAATISVVDSIRRAQNLSQSVEGDSQWGMKLETGSVTLFRGSTYADRDSSYDEITSLADVITPSGDTEIVFSKMSATISASKSISLQSLNSNSKTITINERGTLEY